MAQEKARARGSEGGREEARACAGGGAGDGGVTRATSHRRTLNCNPRHIENLGQKVIPVRTHAHVSRYCDRATRIVEE